MSQTNRSIVLTFACLVGLLCLVCAAVDQLSKDHLVPPDKKLSPAWVKSLYEKGGPRVYRGAELKPIGMPIGGIGAGQLYLGGDGKLWCWDIFNTKGMRDVRGVPTHANPYRRSEPDRRAHHQIDQGFAVRVTTDGKIITRRLDRDGFRDIEFRGQYPIGFVRYSDTDFPVRVELEAFSPFVPLDLDSSTYPATVLVYTVTNTSGRDVSCELYGWLENAVCVKSRQEGAGRLRNRVVRSPRTTMVAFDALEAEPAPREGQSRPDIVFEDFEGDLGKWTAQGDAFEGNPKPNFHHQPLRGHQGKGLADSFRNALNGDKDPPWTEVWSYIYLGKIYDILGNYPIHIDQIARYSKMDPSRVASILTGLELKGIIHQLPGKMFVVS